MGFLKPNGEQRLHPGILTFTSHSIKGLIAEVMLPNKKGGASRLS